MRSAADWQVVVVVPGLLLDRVVVGVVDTPEVVVVELTHMAMPLARVEQVRLAQQPL